MRGRGEISSSARLILSGEFSLMPKYSAKAG